MSLYLNLFFVGICFFLISTFNTKVYSQDFKHVDSIKTVISTESKPAELCLLYSEIATEYYYNYPDSALHYCYIALDYAKESNSITDLSYLCNFIGVLYKNTTQYDSAINYFNLAVPYYEQNDFERGKASALNNLAQTYKLMGYYELALNNYYESLEIFEKHNDTLYIGELHSNIGAVFLEIDDFNAAEEHFQISRNHYSLANSFFKEAWALYDLGSLALKKGELIQAKEYFKNSRNIWISKNRIKEKNDCSLRIAEIDILLGNCKNIIASVSPLVISYDTLNNMQGIAESNLILGKAYSCQNDFQKAIEHLLLAKNVAEQTQTEKLQLPIYNELYLAYKTTSDYPNALKFLELHQNLKDSIISDSKQKLMAEFQIKFNVANKEYFIKQLEDSTKQQQLINELISKENSRKQTSIYVLIVAMGIIIFFIYNIYKRNKKYSLLNRELNSSLKEREALLREVHHRVKNNLQIISSLLNLQSDKAEIGTSEYQTLKISQSRVDAMSMIHESLYKSEKISNINFSEYVDDLCKYISTSFGLSNNNILLVVDVENNLIDIDKMVPCGLIITELITNSIKHAFSENDSNKTIKIHGHIIGEKYRLAISDNGKGLSKDYEISNSDTLGLRLVRGLVKQIKGTIEIKNDNGMSTIIDF